MPTATPCSDRPALISESVMSGLVSTRDRMAEACASILCERRSPPSGPGRGSPCSRANRRHRLTLAALTPKRSPASRWDAPASTADSTRTLRSNDSALAMPASPQIRQTVLNHRATDLGIRFDSFSSETALDQRLRARPMHIAGNRAYDWVAVPSVVRAPHFDGSSRWPSHVALSDKP
jgi:hypothetical protein